MTPFVENLNLILSAGTLLLQLATIALLAAYLLRHRYAPCAWAVSLIGEWGLWKAFAIAFAGSLLTLYYSEVLHFIPCGLCWLQRVFLYPQVVLLGVALWKRDKNIALYSIALSVCGAVIALYQHYLQMGGSSLVPCPAAGAGDCAQRIIFEFGYITFPLMAFSLFAYLIVVMLCVRASREA